MSRGLMLDRRTFLTATASLATGNRLIASPANAVPESAALFVLDRSFATPGSTLQAEVTFIDGDVTALWRDRLNMLWQSGTASVAGITGPAALFCLEQLARGHGRKVSMRQPIAGTNAVRWVISPVATRGHS
jgi:hypothetical protein